MEDIQENFQHLLKTTHTTAVKDTRETNETPSWYIKNYAGQVVSEFKICNRIMAHSVIKKSYYCTLMTFVHYSDRSGGYPVQMAVSPTDDETVAIRFGISDTTWGRWKSLPTLSYGVLAGEYNLKEMKKATDTLQHNQALILNDMNMKASKVHQHPISDISGLEAQLASKSHHSHAHRFDEILGLAEKLDEYASSHYVQEIMREFSKRLNDLNDEVSKNISSVYESVYETVVLDVLNQLDRLSDRLNVLENNNVINVEVVTSLPSSPRKDTLYLVKE